MALLHSSAPAVVDVIKLFGGNLDIKIELGKTTFDTEKCFGELSYDFLRNYVRSFVMFDFRIDQVGFLSSTRLRKIGKQN